ncbi:hypothetical protein [Priestia aryabhattai]
MERKKFIEYIDKLLEQSDAWRKDARKEKTGTVRVFTKVRSKLMRE